MTSWILITCKSILYKIMSGSRLLSHAVSSIVPSAARIFTVVFGMGTGVASARIATRQNFQRISNLSENRRAAPLSELPHRCRHSHPAALARRYMLMSVRSSRPRICSCGHGIHSAFPRCFPHMRTRQKRNPYFHPYKGGDPAAPSDTATLLRLHPSHQPCLRRLLLCS